MSEICGTCGNDALLVWGNHRFDEIGVPVLLKRIRLIKCLHCKSVDPIIPNISDLINAVALAVILQPTKLSGQEVRFLRKFVGKNNKDFSRLLNVDNTHLSKVENNLNGLEIGDQLDKYVRVLVMNMSDSLRDKFVRLLERIPQISNSPAVKQLIEVDIATLECEYMTE